MRFHFQASIKPIFENHVFRAVSGPFHPLYETKISNRWPSVVYGSITLKFFSWALGTISHQWFNRGNKIQKKCFLGHPIDQYHLIIIQLTIAIVHVHIFIIIANWSSQSSAIVSSAFALWPPFVWANEPLVGTGSQQ